MPETKLTLPADKLAELKRAQRDLNDILALMDKAEECDIDCREYRAARDIVSQRIDKLIQNFS